MSLRFAFSQGLASLHEAQGDGLNDAGGPRITSRCCWYPLSLPQLERTASVIQLSASTSCFWCVHAYICTVLLIAKSLVKSIKYKRKQASVVFVVEKAITRSLRTYVQRLESSNKMNDICLLGSYTVCFCIWCTGSEGCFVKQWNLISWLSWRGFRQGSCPHK